MVGSSIVAGNADDEEEEEANEVDVPRGKFFHDRLPFSFVHVDGGRAAVGLRARHSCRSTPELKP